MFGKGKCLDVIQGSDKLFVCGKTTGRRNAAGGKVPDFNVVLIILCRFRSGNHINYQSVMAGAYKLHGAASA